MVRARLVAINGIPVDPSRYGEDRARRLVEREFNVSWTDTLPGTIGSPRAYGNERRPQPIRHFRWRRVSRERSASSSTIA